MPTPVKHTLIFLGIALFAWGGLYLLGNGIAGGGASDQYAPESVRTAKPAVVNLITTATGGGGPIHGRFTNISLSYKLVSENDFKSLKPTLVPLPNNFKVVQSRIFQSENYEFIIPPYPKDTTGEIEYYVDFTFDGHANHNNGVRKIKVVDSI